MSNPAEKRRPGRKPSPPKPNTIVQIVSETEPYLGVVFVVGGVSGDEVHGFLLIPGGGKEYITAKWMDTKTVGKSFITSRTPCSPDWTSRHGQKENHEGTPYAPQTLPMSNL